MRPLKLFLFDRIAEKYRISLSANTPEGDAAKTTISEPGKGSNTDEPVITLTKQ